jgi:hypothetical protein
MHRPDPLPDTVYEEIQYILKSQDGSEATRK